MIPCLPQNDWFPNVRRARLRADRFLYRYDRDYHDLPFPLEWPLLELFPPRYYARFAALTLATDANQVVSSVLTWASSGHVQDDLVDLLRKPLQRELEYLYGEREPPPCFAPDGRTPESLRVYDQLLPLLPQPAAATRWRDHEFFAWQRVAGTYPVALKLVHPNEPLDPLLTQALVRALSANSDRVEAAQGEGRLFAVQYPLAKGLPAGFGDGWRRFMPEMSAYFVRPPGYARILPVAIHCTETGVFTPTDKGWDTARAALQAVESTVHGVAEHGVACHIVMTLVALATYRSLGHDHPLRVLLSPHFEFTIPVTLVTKSFFSAGGRTIDLQSVSLEGCIRLAQRRLAEFDWADDTAPRSIQLRGVLDADVLPEYPFRDDVLLLERVIRDWVNGYVRLYYDDPESIRDDHELQHWLSELGARDCAGLRGIPKIANVDDLVVFVTQIIHRATAYHATINDSVYDAMASIPNMPGACYAPPPLSSPSCSTPDMLEMLPPRSKALAQIADVFVVSRMKLNRLGRYPACTFLDPRVWPLQGDFSRALREAERTIHERNRTRFMPYRVLLPSRITASINV